MGREQILDILRGHLDELRTLGVASLGLFGSAARDEAGPESDVDLLVEFDRPIDLFHFFRVQHRIEEILGVGRVDLVERGAEHPALRERIRREAIRVA